MPILNQVAHQHLIYVNLLTGDGDSTRKPTQVELKLILDSLVASRALQIEDGVVALRKGESERKERGGRRNRWLMFGRRSLNHASQTNNASHT